MPRGARGAGPRPPAPDGRSALGRRAEHLAAELLVRRGYHVIERNYRWRGGELDLVARDGDTLVFVEVRARTRPDWGVPFETVGPGKQRRIARAAEHWLQHHDALRAPARFDVVSVLLPPGAPPTIELIQNAFEL